MKYVDWVNREYGTGDYSLIEAFLVGHDFDAESMEEFADTAERKYTVGRPARSEEWSNLKFVEYSVGESGSVSFTEVVFGAYGG